MRKSKLTRIEKIDNVTKEERKQRFPMYNSLTSISLGYTPRAPLSFPNNSSTGKYKTISNINLRFPVFVKKPSENVEFHSGKVKSLSVDTTDNAETRVQERAKIGKEQSFG